MKQIHQIGLILAVAVSTLLVAGLADEPAAPKKISADGLENVFRVTPNLYSGSGPEGDASFAALKKLGVKTVLSVDGARPDVKRAKKYDLKYVHIPFGYNGVPRDKALQIAKAVREFPGPIYIHCHHGKHRGPTAAAIAQLCADDNCRVEEALHVLRSAGTDPRYTGLFKSVANFRRPSNAEMAKLPERLPEAVVATGVTQAMVSIDHAWDNLKLVRTAGWKTPPAHPDVEPAHEALQLVEALQELQRLPQVAKRPDDFRQWLQDAHTSAADLEKLLRMGKGKSIDRAAADKIYSKAAATCTHCHAKYRDLP